MSIAPAHLNKGFSSMVYHFKFSQWPQMSRLKILPPLPVVKYQSQLPKRANKVHSIKDNTSLFCRTHLKNVDRARYKDLLDGLFEGLWILKDIQNDRYTKKNWWKCRTVHIIGCFRRSNGKCTCFLKSRRYTENNCGSADLCRSRKLSKEL